MGQLLQLQPPHVSELIVSLQALLSLLLPDMPNAECAFSVFSGESSSKSNHGRPVLHHFSKTDVWITRYLLWVCRNGIDGSIHWREEVNFDV